MKDWSGLSTATVPVLCGWVALGQNLPSEGRKDVRTVHASPYHTMQFLMHFSLAFEAPTQRRERTVESTESRACQP